MLVNAFGAGQPCPACNLLRAQVIPEMFFNFHPAGCRYAGRVGSAVELSCLSQFLRLFGPITALAFVSGQFPANRRGASTKLLRNSFLAPTCFLQGVNLVTFRFGDVVIVHRATSTWRLKRYEVYTTSPLIPDCWKLHFALESGAFNNLPTEKKVNNRRHSDGFSVAASPSLQSRACCGRYAIPVSESVQWIK